MKTYCILFLLIATATSFAQEQLNNYKYIIVPKQFDTFKEENQYQTSTLVKYVLENQGFNVFYDDDLPGDLNANRCLGLLVVLVNNSNMFTTKTALAFKDCTTKIVYTTAEGTSKIKEYKGSYHEAIKDALSSLNTINYQYKEPASEAVVVSFKNDVKNRTPIVQNADSDEDLSIKALKNQDADTSSRVAEHIINVVPLENTPVSKVDYYAQPIENGYQLVDSSPKIILKMFATSKTNIFLAEEINGYSGIIYAGGKGEWFFEYYEDTTLRVKSLSIKF
tara:strand:- start:28293 stop:29129 length:837 start_codon:yes stop_codon:yes gene_type:complete